MATPDDRRDRIMELEKKIHQTMNSIKKTETLISNTNNPGLKNEMQKRNKQRYESIKTMQDDINDQNQPTE